MRPQRDFKEDTRDKDENQPNGPLCVTWSPLANRSQAEAVQSMLFVRHFPPKLYFQFRTQIQSSASSVVRVERAPAFGWGNATCRDGFSCAQSLSSGHVTPLPHTEPDMEEAADMFDSNVLPKKYQDGREDFLSFFLFFPPSSPLTKLSLLDLPMTPHSLSDKSLIHVCANTSGV